MNATSSKICTRIRAVSLGALLASASVIIPASGALAQEKAVAGEVVEGSLKGKALTFVSYGGVYQAAQIAALQDFVSKSGVRLLSDGPTEIAKVQAQVESGNVTWDVVDTADFEPLIFCGKLFQKLDLSKIDISNLPPGQAEECSVPSMGYGMIIMYNNEKYKDNPPKDWLDFFDTEKFPGVRAIDASGAPPLGLIEQSIRAAGGDLSHLTPADIDRGLEKIRELGPDTIFYKTGADSQQLVESGEADMAMMWTARAMTAVRNGAQYSPVWKDWLVAKVSLAIPIGVKDPDASHALINAYLGKRAQEIITEKTSNSPVHKDAKPTVDSLTEEFLTTSPDRFAMRHQLNTSFWLANYPLAAEKWTELLIGN